MASLQAAPKDSTKDHKDKVNIINEALRVLGEYKELPYKIKGNKPPSILDLVPSKEMKGFLKPKSLQFWSLPMKDDKGKKLYLTFNVEVLDFPSLGRAKSHSEFVSITDIKVYEVYGVKGVKDVERVFKDKKQKKNHRSDKTLKKTYLTRKK